MAIFDDGARQVARIFNSFTNETWGPTVRPILGLGSSNLISTFIPTVAPANTFTPVLSISGSGLLNYFSFGNNDSFTGTEFFANAKIIIDGREVLSRATNAPSLAYGQMLMVLGDVNYQDNIPQSFDFQPIRFLASMVVQLYISKPSRSPRCFINYEVDA